MVADPAKAGDLKLILAYRGGVVVYLNGQEIARANIPDAEKAKGIEAVAEDYPKEAFVTEDGRVIGANGGDPQKYLKQLQSRVRKLNDVVVPANLLRKGVNVLAIEAHRAPQSEAVFGKSSTAHYEGTKGYILAWCTVGVPRIELAGGVAGVVATNRARPAGVQVWNQDSQTRVRPSDYGDPCEPLRPIRLVAAQNGAFSGEVVVGSSAPLRGLKAVAGDLKLTGSAGSTATIPAANIQIRYALADKDTDLPFDILATDAPAEVAVDKAGGGAVAPVWVTVNVPAGAEPGAYKGVVTITVAGAEPVEVPVELRVVDWKLPDPKDFISHVGLTESPETVAMKYKVEMWSPEHWKLLDKTFELMSEAGADDLFITAIRRTHHGNEHSMIRWIKQADGTFKHDFSIAEKYLDTAIKHLGKVPVVCIYGWEPYTGGSYGGTTSGTKGMLYTILDPATGKLEEAEGPKWGTPEVREFWKPVFDGMREILKKRGLEKSLMVGVSGDATPSKQAVDDLKAVAPDVRWVGQAHGKTSNLYGTPVGYYAEVWASPIPPDPAERRLFGWKNPALQLSFPREGSGLLLRTWSPLAQYRVASEEASAAGIRGFGRVGADFWNVLTTRNKTYGGGLNLIARYPESDWGQLYLGNSTPYLLAPGPDGPLGTARFEMIREGARDLEPRVYLEKALLDPASKAKLGDDLAGRIQQLLDDRVRAILIGRGSWQMFSGSAKRTANSAGRVVPLVEILGPNTIAGRCRWQPAGILPGIFRSHRMSHERSLGERVNSLSDWANLRTCQGLDVSGQVGRVGKLIDQAAKQLERLSPPNELLAREPNSLAAIRAARPAGPRRYWQSIPPAQYRDRVKGAWLGRCAACTLGACVEFDSIAKMQELAKATGGNFPPTDYWPQAWQPFSVRYGKDMTRQYARSHMTHVPVDDDLTYTLLDLLILEDFGPAFTTEDVGKAWLKYLPYACTAEKAALANLKAGVPAKRAALVNNPWLEWIGADIRVDGWGYLAPGWPQKAAELAWRENYVSHRFSGLYGGMFVAAAISAAFALGDVEEALTVALSEIPKGCRTAKAAKWAMGQKGKVRNWKAAREAVDRKFKGMSAVHTDNNLCLTIFGLRIGKKDFTKVIGQTVAMGMDNDCTAATAGSIFGAAYGISAIDPKWYTPFHNKQRSYLIGREWWKISDTLRRFEAGAKKVFAG
jgi:ADP-ribosylglycohydrolase